MSSNPWSGPSQPTYQCASIAQSNNPFAAEQQQPQQQQQQPGFPHFQQPQPTGQGFLSPSQYAPPFQSPQPTGPGRPFVPSTAFGQHLSAQITGAWSQNQQPPQAPPSAQPAAPPPSAVSEFDPFAAISQGWQQQQQSNPSSSSSPNASRQQQSVQPPVQRGEHPRAFIQSHKNELQAWDPVSWKQAANTYADLKATWEERKRLVLLSLDSPNAGPQDKERYSGVQFVFSVSQL
jgi:hypothetical protein